MLVVQFHFSSERDLCSPQHTSPQCTASQSTLSRCTSPHHSSHKLTSPQCISPQNTSPQHTHLNFLTLTPCSGELRTQKLKSHLVRTQSLNVLPLKPGVGQYVAIDATLTARNFFLISTLPFHSSAFFPQTSPDFFSALAVANTGSCVGPPNKIGHPAGCRFPC